MSETTREQHDEMGRYADLAVAKATTDLRARLAASEAELARERAEWATTRDAGNAAYADEHARADWLARDRDKEKARALAAESRAAGLEAALTALRDGPLQWAAQWTGSTMRQHDAIVEIVTAALQNHGTALAAHDADLRRGLAAQAQAQGEAGVAVAMWLRGEAGAVVLRATEDEIREDERGKARAIVDALRDHTETFDARAKSGARAVLDSAIDQIDALAGGEDAK